MINLTKLARLCRLAITRIFSATAWKQPIASFELRNGEPRSNSFSRLIGDLKLNRTSCFLLADQCAITNLSGGNNVLYPQLYEITAA